VDACTVTALDAITAFAVPNPNCPSQSRRFFQVWLPSGLPRRADHSGRSVHRLCSAPPLTHTSRCDGPSHCLIFPPHPWPVGTVSHLADASIRAGDEPGLTDLLRLY